MQLNNIWMRNSRHVKRGRTSILLWTFNQISQKTTIFKTLFYIKIHLYNGWLKLIYNVMKNVNGNIEKIVYRFFWYILFIFSYELLIETDSSSCAICLRKGRKKLIVSLCKNIKAEGNVFSAFLFFSDFKFLNIF